ncbi:ATP-dependent RNA helicase HelY [Arcanobacterium wilhelmae]|uniref:ATP-dependent RNA helicase HelY n=1 Tax=Arcanobacterium wilhelmae TaxID=1803177 RepID=A0ABT9N8J1_9ACTO|nr:DEAD/DEAH box helicase [Arcanobacterium wilhelmae]MDP9800017.1 ATP-dependent RNA helicase HelY [Arcanobacterium wilhelmae]WFN89514.1 DEAD/DEAH box helicase [Arcanobacterium wilhelmae]
MSLIASNFADNYAARGIILDPFQREAIDALERGHDVLVCAPTGSGKTVVAEFAVEMALAREARCVYTAPIKALSNQKYKDLAQRLGEENVGLLTGDVTINRDAPIIVVTTEVLRNMLFTRDPGVAHIGYVVLDEVHYLADPSRGPVWEEVILQLPPHVRLVSLSATVANIEEFSGWLRSVRGPTAVVVSTVRPVPLQQFLARGRSLISIDDGMPAPRRTKEREFRRRERRAVSPARRRRLVESLNQRGLLPAIEFIFSRKGCDQAVADFLDSGVLLNSPEAEREVRRQVSKVRETLSDSDAKAVRWGFWAKAMGRGFSAHHAGMFPVLKELAESLMDQGLLKLVFATGTLALGIDMPVSTVIIDELRKFNGEDFVNLTATEYTQLIGRAGRRGKDTIGTAVVIDTDELDMDVLGEVAKGQSEPLMSAFFPSYNTVVNLLANYSPGKAREIMGTSFAQYQRNADLGQVQGRLARVRARLADVEEELARKCERGNLVEYLRLRAGAARASKAQRKRAKAEYHARIRDSFAQAATGMLYAYALDGELEYALVLSVGNGKLRVINAFGEMYWLREDDLSAQMRLVGEIAIPFGRSLKEREVREQIADSIIDAVDERSELGVDRDLMGSWDRFAVRESPELIAHPVHTCPDLAQHLREGEELVSLDARVAELEQMVASYDDSVAREFDATASVLERIGYLQRRDGTILLGPGADVLRGIHNEADLLVCEALSAPNLRQLSPAQFAGAVSAFLCDRRLGSRPPSSGELRDSWRMIGVNVDYLLSLEADAGITRTPDPFPGAMGAVTRWAEGGDLERVLREGHLVVGDFISAMRRLIDLLGQIEAVGNGVWFGERAAEAKRLIKRWDWL